MILKIGGLEGLKDAQKTKSKARVDGPKFADFLTAAEGAEGVLEDAGGMPTGGQLAAYVPLEDATLPQNGKQQAAALMQTLKDLAQDAFAGSPSAAVGRLEQLAREVGDSDLTPAQRQVVEELRTRAAVEVAKLAK